ncbi:hypothetical protein [Micromonospora sp. LOL_024]|uniref:hypothetical protein n=1 Tax=Micromonospora sp. LOL_024 TaxID=3345412 RepID=UPI003A85EBC4
MSRHLDDADTAATGHPYDRARHDRPPPEPDFQKVTLNDRPGEPMDLAVLPDRRVLHVTRAGQVRLHNPSTGRYTIAATLDVYQHDEEGLRSRRRRRHGGPRHRDDRLRENLPEALRAGVHPAAVTWYKQWIGRNPDVEPTEGVAEWQLTDNAWIQVSLNPEAAGRTSVVVGVEDMDSHIASLASAGVTFGEVQDFDFIKMSELVDPAGNRINFVWENPRYEPPAE